ncbi:MAG: serine/threonine protein kinase [Planctomycetaceae bacterium]|nr:MAG: serine/threonine protein kinase [Planctomycetaceae bacterium]
MMLEYFKKLFQPKPKVVKLDISKRFELLNRTGQGSMSKVWRARDTLTNQIVALKLLDLQKTKRFEARFQGFKTRKPSEGEIAISLKHPHIVETYEYGITTHDEQYLVMEFIDGVSLTYLIDLQNEVMKQHRLRFMIELGEAIDYFHRQNWIHRDICPRNVMLDRDYSVKLIDFGLVVPNIEEYQQPGNRTGTANYMAPELIKRQRTDQRIDIFSYAVTCYEMWAKRLPWDAAETLEAVLQHINAPPLDIRQAAPGIPEEIAQVIMKGLAVDPRDRWQTMSEMLHPLRAYAQQKSASATAHPRRTPPKPAP